MAAFQISEAIPSRVTTLLRAFFWIRAPITAPQAAGHPRKATSLVLLVTWPLKAKSSETVYTGTVKIAGFLNMNTTPLQGDTLLGKQAHFPYLFSQFDLSQNRLLPYRNRDFILKPTSQFPC